MVREGADWLDSPPPRSVPESVLRSKLPRGRLRATVLVAITAVVASIPIYEFVVPKRLVADLRLNLGDPQILHGELLETTSLDLRRKTDTGQAAPVQQFRFRFVTADGRSIEGTSHGLSNPHGRLAELPIEVDPDDPGTSRIRGTTCSAEPLFGVFALMFPFVPLVWVFSVQRQRRRVRGLLRNGRIESAEVESIEQVRPPGAAGTTRAEVRFSLGPDRIRRHRPSPTELSWIESCAALGREVPLLVSESELMVLAPLGAAGGGTEDADDDEDPYRD